jgi:hypothetical protein
MALSFSHHKASLESPTLAKKQDPLRTFVQAQLLPRYMAIHHKFQNNKEVGVYDIEKVHTLRLMAAEFSMNNKWAAMLWATPKMPTNCQASKLDPKRTINDQ